MVSARAQIRWYRKSGHCGGCGQPGEFCLCRETKPCACRRYHPMGSGLKAHPAEVFAENPPDQVDLFEELWTSQDGNSET